MADGLRERKKRAIRRAISDAATQLFMANGFDNTSVAEIADIVGVSPQTVLNYFPAKTDLFFDEKDWYAGPPQAVRDGWPRMSPAMAVREWYLADLQRRYGEGHVEDLTVYLQTIADSETLRRRRLDDLAALTSALCAALDDTSADGPLWDRQLSAAILTSAIMVAESETARLSQTLAGADLLAAAQAAAASIFERTAHACVCAPVETKGLDHDRISRRGQLSSP
jgi:AcrR family transcriptional regulator